MQNRENIGFVFTAKKRLSFPIEIPHDIPEQELNEAFGEGNWKNMPDEIFWQLRFEPAKWIAEKHIIKVYVGTDGVHQDEFLRGDHPETMFKSNITMPSLETAIINAKYVNSNPSGLYFPGFKARSDRSMCFETFFIFLLYS